MIKTYVPIQKTLGSLGEIANGYYEEKKSKFYSYIFRIDKLEEVEEHIKRIEAKYNDARHIVYAYILGDNFKFCDDGEPSGTAGKMIYGIMEKQKVSNSLIIAVRYFGGTLLGAGNLSRAYLKCAKSAIDKCEVKVLEETEVINISYEFNEENIVREKVKTSEGQILSVDYNEKIYMLVSVPKSNSILFQKWIQSDSNV